MAGSTAQAGADVIEWNYNQHDGGEHTDSVVPQRQRRGGRVQYVERQQPRLGHRLTTWKLVASLHALAASVRGRA